MKLSKDTLYILNQFSNINDSLHIKPGNRISVIDNIGAVFATAEVDETFPIDIYLTSIKKFVSILSLYNTPDIVFGQKNLTIKENGREAKFLYGIPDHFRETPNGIKLSKENAVGITTEDLQDLLKAAYVVQAECIKISKKGAGVVASAETKSYKSNSFEIPLHTVKLTSFKDDIFLDVNRMKMIPKDYNIYLEENFVVFETPNGNHLCAIAKSFYDDV